MQQQRQRKQGTVPMESLLPFNALNAEQQDLYRRIYSQCKSGVRGATIRAAVLDRPTTSSAIQQLSRYHGVGFVGRTETAVLAAAMQADTVQHVLGFELIEPRKMQLQPSSATGDMDPPPPPPSEIFKDELLEWAFREIDIAAGLSEPNELRAADRLERLLAVGRRAGIVGCGQQGLEDILRTDQVPEWALKAHASTRKSSCCGPGCAVRAGWRHLDVDHWGGWDWKKFRAVPAIRCAPSTGCEGVDVCCHERCCRGAKGPRRASSNCEQRIGSRLP